jgi:homoserine/homoserine lactone efflux protein
MAPASSLGLYAAATLLICLSPGPNVLLMISLGLRSGSPAVLRGVAGVLSASLVYLAVAALGLVAALTASRLAFTVVRYLGAAYLVYIGLALVVGSLRSGSQAAVEPPRPGRAFWQGFITHLSNPKAVLFWTALLPQFLDPRAALAPQILLLGLLAMLMDAIVLSGYGLSAAAARHRLPSSRFAHWMNLVAGVFFTVTGTLLALAHRGPG